MIDQFDRPNLSTHHIRFTIKPIAKMSFMPSVLLPLLLATVIQAAEPATPDSSPGNRMAADYFKAETAKVSEYCLTDIKSLADWQARRPELRRQAAEMLGLDPMPERTDLKPVITGKLEQETFTVEKLYFQSSPHLYVTANLYLPKNLTKPAPAILYLCGHTRVFTNGVSCGNKTAYQHHAIWFARNGYVCLVIDTLQLGEIEGRHYGTYREGMWWWNSRGYTPAGVEVWDSIRALDYLVSRPEVDPNRIGVTGRSGGGAYTWFLAGLDDRVKVMTPVAGITDLQNYVVDGAVQRHCDCMFLVNTYRWDYPLLAALCAPRPLLMENTDADDLFPLDGVMRTHEKVKQIYALYHASTNFGVVIGPGPHQDTQNLQLPAFRWFNLHLKHEDPIIDMAAVKMFPPQELKVFDQIPADQINTTIQSSFVAKAPQPAVPATTEAWHNLSESWMKGLREKCFAGWPADSGPPAIKRLFSVGADGIQYEAYEIQSQSSVPLRTYLMRKIKASRPGQIFMRVAGSSETNFPAAQFPALNPQIREAMNALGTPEVVATMTQEIKARGMAYAVFMPRGIGPTAWTGGVTEQAQMRRRFMLLGQTLDGMRVWDIRRAVQALRSLKGFNDSPLWLEAQGEMGVNVLYASLFEPGISGLDLRRIPFSHMEGPDYLNVLKILDIPEAVAMAAERCAVRLEGVEAKNWEFPTALAKSPAMNLKFEIVRPLSGASRP